MNTNICSDEKLLDSNILIMAQYIDAILKTTTDGFYVIDLSGRYIDVNERYCTLTGYTRSELLSLRIYDLDMEESDEVILERIKRAVAVGSILFEKMQKRKDGTVFEIEVSSTFTDINDGRLICFCRDITLRKQTEMNLHKSRETLNMVLNTIPQSVFWKDANSTYLGCNQVFASTAGLKDAADIVGRTDYDLPWPRQEADAYRADDCQVIQSNTPKRHIIEPLQKADGTRIWIDTSKIPLFDANGVPFGILGVYDDITERIRNEENLKKSEASLKMAQQMTHTGNWELDLKKNRLFWSDEIYRIFEIDPKAFGATYEAFLETIHPDDREAVNNAYTHSLKNGTSYSIEHRLLMKNGSIKYVHEYCETDVASDGTPVCSRGTVQDITETKLTEIALRRERDFSQNIIQSTNAFFVIISSEGKVIMMNQSFLKALGYTEEEVVGKNYLETFIPENEQNEKITEFKKLTESGNSTQAENHVVCKDGKKILVEWHGRPIMNGGKIAQFFGLGLDITDRKRAEEERHLLELQINQMQKLEALGILAGGIAHDFNNLLGGIFGNLDLAIECSNEKPVKQYLDKAMNAIERSRSLTQQLLTFAKGGSPIRKTGNVVTMVKDATEFALSGSSISAVFNLPDDIMYCDYDKNQIEQVIDNIVINAQQAMPDGGSIEVSAENIVVDAAEHSSLLGGKYVKLSFRDYGVGMTKEILQRIFDPFFTTKTKGHGLGLATAYSIIRRHGGSLEVQSEPGKGSTFYIYLPVSESTHLETSVQSSASHHGSGVILIMDDELVVREAIGDIVQSLGYSVIYKDNGKEVVEFFQSSTTEKKEIVCMFFDLTIPGGLGGKEVIGEIRKINQEIPVFVISGYADDPVMAHPNDYGFTASICKPFRKSDVIQIFEHCIPKHTS